MRVIYGRAGRGKTRLCLTEIREQARRDPDGPLLLLIVPEQATLRLEKELADSLGGLWRVQVLSFQRLARRVLAETGGSQKVRLTESGSHMLVTKIMLEHRTELRRLGSLAASSGMAAKIARSVAELKAEGVTPADLRGLPWLPARDVREKMADLALIYECYAEAMSRAGGDMADLLTEAAAGLGDCAFLREAEVWVDGFTGFSWPERALLKALLKTARHMTVTLALDPAPGAEIDIFAKSARTYDRLAEMAAEAGRPLTPLPLKSDRGACPDALAHLEQNLFRYPTQPFAAELPPATVNICCAADPRREAEYTAAAVLRLAAESTPWERIAVATRDLATYSPLLEQEFSRCGIPYFTDHKRGMTGHPLVALVLALLELARAPWREEALFAAIKTGFFPLEGEEADRLENHCLAQGVEAWQWASSREFGGPAPVAAAAGAVKDMLTPFFARVRAAEQTPGHYRVTDLSEALYDCLERLGAPRTLQIWTEGGAPGDVYVQLHAQVWRELMRLLDELVSILGDETMPLADCAAMLQSGVAAISIGVVPPRRREVQIGSLERSRLPEVDALFLLGASEGALPPRQADDSFLDERDRLALGGAGVTWLPRSRDSYFEEMFFIYAALSKPRSSLYVVRPLSDGGGGEKSPSFLLGRLKQIFPGLNESFAGREKRAATARAWNIPETAALDAATRRALYGDWLQVSVTELERYAACPFEHFARDWLRLRERPRAEAGSPEAGQLYHHALWEFGRALGEKAGRGEVVGADWCAERMGDLFAQVAAHSRYQAFRRNNRNWGRAERIREVLLYVAALLGEHLRAGSFLPWAFEKSFGAGAAWPPLAAGKTGNFGVGGQIDRIDLARVGADNYLRVIDYKSGRAAFFPEQFHYGLSLQLPLYMEAALRFAAGGDVKPAGFLYFPVREPDVSSDGPLTAAEAASRKKRKTPPSGMLLDNGAVLAAMDKNIAAGYSELLNISFGSGENKPRGGADLLTAGQMTALRWHLRRLLLAGEENLLAGDVRIRPYKLRENTACAFCGYESVCHFDPYLPEYEHNWLAKLELPEIWGLWNRGMDSEKEGLA